MGEVGGEVTSGEPQEDQPPPEWCRTKDMEFDAREICMKVPAQSRTNQVILGMFFNFSEP